MGDGRYYTYDQFFNTIFFTTAIIFLEVCFMINLFKGTRYKKYIITSGLLLSLSLLSRFVEEVGYKKSRIEFYGNMSHICLGLFVLVFAIYFYKYLKENEDRNGMVIIMSVFYFLPIVIGIIFPRFEVLYYTIFISGYTIVSSRLVNYRVSGSVFADVKKLLIDDVFITGVSGKIIYKSDQAQDSTIFKQVEKINNNKFQDFFIDEVIIRDAFGKQIVKTIGQDIKYFHHNEKTIEDKDGVAGYIHTFTEITPLIAMLDELKKNQDETTRINDELLKYKEIVYEIEREKEINNLLDEIANNQQKSMGELKNNIEALDFEDESFVGFIDKLIETAKEDLSNVRAHVTTYMNYYSEGANNDKNNDR